ncbi:SDR family oxidoreductase [Flavobacterium sp. J27]|uniref:SDR family oxidoreductase n=1 Tax=Flavobacterium sp. J27 TaxID=2060419 RepID=UPI0010323130|nr:SDR family oxidoreductase [Flavobacterium sp. J27]
MNKKILITGGTSGIGLACAKYLIEKNYEVIITGRNKESLDFAIQELENKAYGYISDTSKLNEIENLVYEVQKNHNNIDGLFINAGIFKSVSFENTTESMFDETMNINFKGAFFTIQKFLPLLTTGSSIVLNTSIAVFKAFPNTSVYTASKAALESLAQVLNLELASRKIRVNIVSPGVTRTPIQQKSGMTEEAINNLLQHFATTSPIGRVVLPEDIAPIVGFLISEASSVLRNEKIIVDGGTTL